MVTYFDIGWWYYKELNPIDPVSNIFYLIVASLGGVFQTSLLGLFFLLGGYFTPKSYDRKGVWKFWGERLVRLGIPLFVYILILNPLIIFLLSKLGISPWNTNPMLQGSFFDYYFSRFYNWGDFIDFISFGGPMWFLRVLLIFTALYTLWRQIIKIPWIQRRIPEEFLIPRFIYLLILAIVLGILTFFVRIVLPIDERPLEIPWGQLIQYLLMFSTGIICIRYRWFEKMTKKHVKIWLITIIISMVVIYIDFGIAIALEVDLVEFSGGFSVHAFLFALVDSVICMGMIFVLIRWFYTKFNAQKPIIQNVSKSAYNMYLLHPIVLLGVSLLFLSIRLFAILKLFIIFPLTVLLCFLVSHFVIENIHFRKPSQSSQES